MTTPAITPTTGSTAYVDPTWDAKAGKAASATTTAKTDNSTLSSQAFLQLLVAQLQYQDPSKPVDTASFMQETATLSQVQTSETNAKNNADLLAAANAQTASGLVGRTVTYKDGSGGISTGVVSSATISTATPTLKIGNDVVQLTSIQEVKATSSA